MIQVIIPSQLESYTDNLREVTVDLAAELGAPVTLADLVAALDARYPGMAFRIVDEQRRIRKHIAIFIGQNLVRTLAAPLRGDERVQIVGALSGG